MIAPMSYTLLSGVVTPETEMGIAMYQVTASWVPYHIHTA